MNKQPAAQATLFIPPGQIHLRGAVPIAAEKWQPEQFAALKLMPEEEQSLSSYNAAVADWKCYLSLIKNAGRGESKKHSLRPGTIEWLKPEKKQLIKAIEGKREGLQSLFNETWKRLAGILFSDALPVKAITDNGEVFDVKPQYWGSRDGQAFYASPFAKIRFQGAHFITIEGIPFLDPAHLENVLAGRPAVPPSEVPVAPSTLPQDRTRSSTVDVELKDKGGAPTQFEWDEIWAEIVRMIYVDGLPQKKAHLIKKIQEWCSNKYDKEPSASTLKPKVALIFKALERGEDG